MTDYCPNCKKATVIFKHNGVEERVVSPTPPVKVECLETATGMRIGVRGDGADANKHIPGLRFQTDPNGSINDSYSIRLAECSTAIGCGDNSPDLVTGEKDLSSTDIKKWRVH